MNGFQLKCFALILMVLDHIHQFFPNTPVILSWMGRIVAPIFFYLMVEGYCKTRNRWRYIRRMWIAACIMALGSGLLMLLLPNSTGSITNNIFISLGFGLLMLQAWEWSVKQHTAAGSLLLLFAAIGGMLSEAWLYGVAMTFIFYGWREKRIQMLAVYVFTMLLLTVGWETLYGAHPLTWHTLFYEQYQWMMIAAVLPIMLYNGERGYNAGWAKYSFYAIYPLHIWMLYLLSALVY